MIASKLFNGRGLAILIIFFSSVDKLAAQEISLGIELAAPVRDLSKAVGGGFGVSARYENEFGRQMSWLIDAGILSFAAKTSGSSITMVPVQAGLKYYLRDQINGLYLMGEAGLHAVSGNKSEVNFSLAPGIGYYISDFDFGLRYQVINSSQGNYDYIGFRAAYIFPDRRK